MFEASPATMPATASTRSTSAEAAHVAPNSIGTSTLAQAERPRHSGASTIASWPVMRSKRRLIASSVDRALRSGSATRLIGDTSSWLTTFARSAAKAYVPTEEAPLNRPSVKSEARWRANITTLLRNSQVDLPSSSLRST